MARGEEELVVGAESESGHGLGISFESGFYRGVGGIDDVYLFVAGTYQKGSVGGDGVGSSGVQLLESWDAAVVLLQARRRH